MRYMKTLALVLALGIIILAPAPVAAQTYMVYPNGRADVTVPADQYINVYTEGSSSAQVYKQVGGPSTGVPPSWALETNGTVHNQETVFGPYTTGATVRILAGTDPVRYSVGLLAVALPTTKLLPALPAQVQLAPVSYTTTQTMLASDLMSGLITGTQSSGATVTYTLPTGTLMDAALNLPTGGSFDWCLINLSSSAANTLTVAAGSGHTLVGNAVVGVATSAIPGSAMWRTRKTATNTFVTYRLN